MAFTNAQIADYYKSTVGSGSMTEADFVTQARANGINDKQLLDTRQEMLSGGVAAPVAPAATTSSFAAAAPPSAPSYGYGSPATVAPAATTSSFAAAAPPSAPSYGYGSPAPAAPSFTDAQVASYFKNNNLDDAGISGAAKAFGLSPGQVASAKGLLASGNSSVQAASDAYSASIANRPDLAAQNASFYNPSTGAGWGVSPNGVSATDLGNHAHQSRWASADQGAIGRLNTAIAGFKSGSVSSADVGKMALEQNLSGAQLAELINAGLGTSYSPQQAVEFARASAPAGTKFGPSNDYAMGYGGWQPLGSIYAGDNPMPASYIARLPEIDASTQNAVNAALQKALAISNANGVTPEQSNIVQTLRGFYANDPQLKSKAIRTAATFLTKDELGSAYETADYGHHAIAGFDKTVEAPTFEKAFDPEWDRPTLYDMINSSMGWSESNNNYADPSKRDATLNRRLSDDEIRAFQEGKLPGYLQGQVEAYRGKDTVGGPVVGTGGGGGGSAGGGGGIPSGNGGYGTSAGGSYSSSTATSTGGPVTTRQVQYGTETIEGRIQNLLGTDGSGNYTNPVVQQAANRAMQSFAGRGLLNSSMAQQAAIEAATSKAIEIAGPDAQTYFSQGRANQDAANVFERDDRGYKQDQIKLDKTLGVEREKMALNQSQFSQTMALDREKLAMSGSQFNQELKYKYDAVSLGEASRKAAEDVAHKNALEINSNTDVSRQYEMYLNRISNIDANADYDEATKVKMKNSAGNDFDLYVKAKKIVWGDALGDMYKVADSTATTSGAGSATSGGILDTAGQQASP